MPPRFLRLCQGTSDITSHKRYLATHTSSPQQNFQIQLGPFIEEIEKNTENSFLWIDGTQETTPPAGFEDYFGAPPLYRHMEFDGINSLDDMLTKIRDFPEGMSAEDTMRQLLGEAESFSTHAVQKAMDRLLKIIDEDPEIDVCSSTPIFSYIMKNVLLTSNQ